jgi:hypothetical protein
VCAYAVVEGSKSSPWGEVRKSQEGLDFLKASALEV